MTTKAYVSVALAVWMTWAAFLALPANAGTAHVVAGGVFGQGGIVSPGTGNAANEATFAFYSTNQPTYAALAGADVFTAADGTNPALFYRDVGSAWSWSTGDIVVGVVETIRGTNGWANVNYTTSLRSTLQNNPTTTEMGNGTLEQIPPVTPAGGTGYVRLAWTALTDAQANILSYHLYSAPALNGPYGSLATVNHAAGALTYNNTGVAPGLHCYELAVQYRRDLTGGTYETTGRSEPVCATSIAPPPRIVSSNPANGAVNVAVNADIVVTFDQAIDRINFPFTYTIFPGVGPTVDLWNPGNTQVTITHAANFAICTTYTVTFTSARNADGTNLQPPTIIQFTTACPNPLIQSTTPANAATGVPTITNVVVQFSKTMNTGSVIVTFTPIANRTTCTSWNSPANDRCTLAVTLAEFTSYSVSVTGTDTGGANLVAGPVPNPFTFVSNALPVAAFTLPGTGECHTGGSNVLITWTMSDRETVAAGLQVWLNWTDGIATSPIAGAQPLPSQGSPAQFTWTAPSQDKSTVSILMNVVDNSGQSVGEISNPFSVDATAPTVTLDRPLPSSSNVVTNANVTLRFSESMNAAATEPAITFSPATTGLTFIWFDGGQTVTVVHPAFQATTPYTLTVSVGAKDACSPGLPLSAPYTATFTTGAGVNTPKPPTNVRVTSNTTNAATITWTAPTSWEDGTTLPPSDITGYTIYRANSQTGAKSPVGTAGATRTFTDTGLTPNTAYFYFVTASVGSLVSDYSGAATAQTLVAPPEGFNWLLVILPLVVIVLLVLGFLLLRRKKPTPAPPTRAAPKEAPPEGETGGGGSAAESGEEAGEKFIPCPNCGTMVKPTDAECFVCGAKL